MYKNKKIWSNLSTKPYQQTNKYENYSRLFYVVRNNLVLHDRMP